jgi:twitching motility protein PilJ
MTKTISSSRLDTFRQRLLLTFIPTVLLPLAIASIVGYLRVQDRESTQATQRLIQQSQLISRTTDAFTDKAFVVLRALAKSPLVLDPLEQKSPESTLTELND